MLLREAINSKRKGPTIFSRRQHQNNVNVRNDEQRVTFEQLNTFILPSSYSEGYTTATFMFEANDLAIELFKEDDQEAETLVKENQVVIINRNQVTKKLVKDAIGEKSFVFNWENLQEDNFFKIINNSSIALYRNHGVKGGNIMFHEKIQSLAIMNLISASKQAKLLSNEAYLQLMEIDRHNKNMPDSIIHLNNKLKITVQLKSRDIERFGLPTENWMVTILKDYKNTDVTFLIIDEKFVDKFMYRFKDFKIVKKEDNIIIMTVNNEKMQKNLLGILSMIFEQVNGQNQSTKFSHEFINIEDYFVKDIEGLDTNQLNKKDDSTLDDLSLNEKKFDDGKNKMELAQKIQCESRFIKTKAPDKTLFDTNIYVPIRWAQTLKDNNIELTPANIFIAKATGLISDN